ncbi:MAG: hypothetical protein M3O22_03330 [Pseudomonadota bacterium]|nr:hypothetical protein [Pseudomonadota bacterium]
MKRAFFLSALAGTAVAVFPAMAAEGKQGLPQLDPAYIAPQIFWLVVIFSAFLAFMFFLGVPRIERTLARRHKVIADDIDQASAMKANADALVARYQERLDKARQEAQAFLAAESSRFASESASRHATLSVSLLGKTQKAETALAEARQKALAALESAAAGLVNDVLSAVSGKTANSPDSGHAVRSVVE